MISWPYIIYQSGFRDSQLFYKSVFFSIELNVQIERIGKSHDFRAVLDITDFYNSMYKRRISDKITEKVKSRIEKYFTKREYEVIWFKF